MTLNFNTPEELSILLKIRENKIKEELIKNKIVFINKNKLFELGNTRVEFFQNFNKNVGKETYIKNWEGKLEYQGAFLYGNFTTNYEFQKKYFGDFEIEYSNIFKKHDFKIGSYKAGDLSRELGFSLNKDKGYYELGKNFIITENVPIGSKVELLYMDYPIEIKNAENGQVTFDNPLIKSDRSYQLKIYTPEGNILLKYINTAQNFNQQNKGEIEYDISFKEHHSSDKYGWNARAYYGLSNNLTLGLINERFIENKEKNKYRYLDKGRVELTYSNQINNNIYPITLRIGTDQILTKRKTNFNKNYKNKYKYKYNGLAQINIKNLLLTFEKNKYGNFYDEKYEDVYELKYSGFGPFSLGYKSEITKYRKNIRKDIESSYNIYYDKGISSDLLFSSEIKIDHKNDEEYRTDMFYTGFDNFNINWRNLWKKKLSNYETEIELYKSDYFDVFDYTFTLSYSEKAKERIAFNFTFDYESFFKFTGNMYDKGNRNFKVGIDKVFNLKNIKKTVDSIDSSRVKVISFIDYNDNNIYDLGEKKVDNVQVKIRNQKKITNKNGEAVFYGIPNNTLFDLNPTIRKPSFSLGNNKIKIRGVAASTIEAYIPIKPMLTLEGKFEITEMLKINTLKKQNLLNNIIITIKDSKNEVVEVTVPDELGEFLVSNIYPGKYLLEMKYLGDDLNIKDTKEKIELLYNDNFSPKVIINIYKDKFSLKKG